MTALPRRSWRIIATRSLPLVLLPLLLLAPEMVHAQERVPPVTVGRAEQMPVVQEVPVTGTVISPQVSRVSAEVSARVDAVRVDVGDRVEAGDLLATLDAELARIDLDRARAATREAVAGLADARRRLDEAERLLEQKAIEATALRSLRAEVEMDEAVLARVRADEARQRALVERHEVKAPFAGAVSRKLAYAGEWIEPGTPVVEIVSTDDLSLDFPVPQEYFPRVGPDTEVEVTLDAEPGRRLVGRVDSTVPQSDPSARTFLVRVRLQEDGVAMIPGMSARARLRLGTGVQGVVVPRDALLRHPDGRVTVWVVNGAAASGRAANGNAADGHDTVSERRVLTGRTFDGRVEILEGIEAGTPVVLRGNEGLREGQRVRVQGGPGDV
jgi:RND family efflux transporter MFP subunit